MPYYFEVDEPTIMKLTQQGPPQMIHPQNRSFIERRMIEIMERCYQMEPAERPGMVEVVQFLKDTLDKIAHRDRADLNFR